MGCMEGALPHIQSKTITIHETANHQGQMTTFRTSNLAVLLQNQEQT